MSYQSPKINTNLKNDILVFIFIIMAGILALCIANTMVLKTFLVLCGLIITYGLSYWAETQDKREVALILFLGIPVLIIMYLSLFVPSILYESLFYIPLAISSLIYLYDSPKGKKLFILYLILCCFFQVYEYLSPPPSNISPHFAITNKVLFFIGLACTFINVYFAANIIENHFLNFHTNEQANKNYQKQFQNICDNSIDAIYIIDRNQKKITYYNQSFQNVFKTHLATINFVEDSLSILPQFQADGRTTLEHIKELNKQLDKDQKMMHFGFIHRRFDGENFETETSLIPNENDPNNLLVIVKDISKQKKAEQQLKESEMLYRGVCESSLDAMLVLNRKQGKITYQNDAFHKLFRNENKSQGILENTYRLMPETQPDGITTKEVVQNAYKYIDEHQKPLHINLVHRRLDGEMFETETSFIPHKHNPDEVMIVVRDISKRKEAERKLKESETLYRHLFEAAYDGLEIGYFEKENPSEKYRTFRNLKFLQIYGRSEEELNNLNAYLDFAPKVQSNGQTSKEMLVEIQTIFNAQGSVRFEWQLIDSKEKIRELDISIHKIEIDDEKFAIAAIFKDITEIKQTQRILEIRETLFREMVSSNFDGVELLKRSKDTTDFITLERNDKLRKLFGRTDKELNDKGGILAFSPDLQPNGVPSREHLQKTVKNFNEQNFQKIEWQFQHKNGRLFDTNILVKVITLHGDTYQLTFYQDVTKTKKQQAIIQKQLQALHNQNQKLQQYIDSNMQLENFAYIASHDLQAPLRTISSFSQILVKTAKDKLDQKEQNYLSFIINATQNMEQLIKDLLSYSKVNTSKRILKSVNIKNLIEEITLEIHTTIAEKNARVETENLPTNITADKIKIRQLFQNLMTNALKFTKPDVPPILTISCSETPYFWKFAVADNGIGIAPENQEKIFLLFRRLHTKESYPGTGIGLAICHKIVEQHEGEIRVESIVGEGATFYFTIKKDIIDTDEDEEE